jgi:hypothetical protein
VHNLKDFPFIRSLHYAAPIESLERISESYVVFEENDRHFKSSPEIEKIINRKYIGAPKKKRLNYKE